MRLFSISVTALKQELVNFTKHGKCNPTVTLLFSDSHDFFYAAFFFATFFFFFATDVTVGSASTSLVLLLLRNPLHAKIDHFTVVCKVTWP